MSTLRPTDYVDTSTALGNRAKSSLSASISVMPERPKLPAEHLSSSCRSDGKRPRSSSVSPVTSKRSGPSEPPGAMGAWSKEWPSTFSMHPGTVHLSSCEFSVSTSTIWFPSNSFLIALFLAMTSFGWSFAEISAGSRRMARGWSAFLRLAPGTNRPSQARIRTWPERFGPKGSTSSTSPAWLKVLRHRRIVSRDIPVHSASSQILPTTERVRKLALRQSATSSQRAWGVK